MNIVLIGYRGTGKSTVGRILASRYSLEYISMDETIVERTGLSIPQIVEQSGWDHFRDLESQLADELSRQDGFLIDTGGGVIERENNIEALKADAVIVWLRADVDTIISRIASSTERPALTAGNSFTDEVSEVLARRTPMYEAAANICVSTDGRTPEEIVDLIIEAGNEL